MKTIIVLLSLTILMPYSSYSQNKDANSLDDGLYKKIKAYKEQPEYWIFIHSNNCSYTATVNDMPIYTDFNDGSMKSLSFPLNPLLPTSGTYGLKLRVLPKQDDTFNLASKIEKSSSIQIKISRTVGKEEKTILDETLSIKEDDLPYLEKTFNFNVEVPYSLTGWSKSTNLQKENEDGLKKEVADFYQNMMSLYEKREIAAISNIYYLRQLENAQTLYLSGKDDTEKLIAKLSEEINRVQKFRLEDYKLQFYANGKVVGLIRTDGEFLGKSAFLGLTEQKFFIYSLLLHRPKPGASLEVIR